MPAWRFLEYLTDDVPCRSPFLEWYGVLDENVKAEFDILVKELTETEDWDEPRLSRRKYKELTRTHAGLCQLMFKAAGRQFRPLGIRNVRLKTFLLLGGFQKGGRGAAIPEDAWTSALKMKAAFESERGRTREYH